MPNLKEINVFDCNLDHTLIEEFIYGIAKSDSIEKINVLKKYTIKIKCLTLSRETLFMKSAKTGAYISFAYFDPIKIAIWSKKA